MTKCLTHEPELRPTLDNILMDEFFTSGHYPNRLSSSVCTSPPRYQSPTSSTTSQNIRASRCATFYFVPLARNLTFVSVQTRFKLFPSMSLIPFYLISLQQFIYSTLFPQVFVLSSTVIHYLTWSFKYVLILWHTCITCATILCNCILRYQ